MGWVEYPFIEGVEYYPDLTCLLSSQPETNQPDLLNLVIQWPYLMDSTIR